MALSPNYGWAEPDNSSLVKNGAQDIRALGDAIDSSLWAVGYGQAGKNRIINGDFGISQRGTSFSITADNTYTLDRFTFFGNGSGYTKTVTQQSFTPGTAPVAGYEGTSFCRFAQSVAGTSGTYNLMMQKVENARTFAGQTVTFSMWVKADAARTCFFSVNRNYGSGGTSQEYSIVTDTNISVTTAWQRFSYTFVMPSVTGKTIGAGSFIEMNLNFPNNTAQTIETWGWQLEYGSKATPFQTATGTIQGELAACQRYYNRIANGTAQFIGPCYGQSASRVDGTLNFPTMRIAPSLIVATGTNWYVNAGPTGGSFNDFTGYYATTSCIGWYSGTSTTQAVGYGGGCYTNNASASVALSAEL
jgi:hypothetical protein